MSLEEYQKLQSDASVFKLNEHGGINFITENEKFVLMFTFIHQGYNYEPIALFTESKRIDLKILPFERFKLDIPFTRIKNNALIMVNTDNARYAMTFQLEVNEDAGEVKVKLKNKPESGIGLITNEETNGIALQFQLQ